MCRAIASRFHRSPAQPPRLPINVVFRVNGLATVEVEDEARRFLEASIWEVLPSNNDRLLIRFSPRDETVDVLSELFPGAVEVEFQGESHLRLADKNSGVSVELAREY